MKKSIRTLFVSGVPSFCRGENIFTQKIVFGFLLFVAAGSVTPAAAVCSWADPSFHKGTIEYTHSHIGLNWSPTRTSFYNMATYNKDAIHFATSMGASSETETLVNCTAGETLRFDRPNFSQATSEPGIIFRFPIYYAVCGDCLFGGDRDIPLDISGNINAQFLSSNRRVGTQFAQSPILLTKVNGRVERQYVGTVRTSDGLELLDIYLGEWTFSVTPCEVGSYDDSVDLGNHSITDFRTPGSTLDAAQFTLNMACAMGITPKMTFAGEVHSEHPDVLTNKGEATGVGLTLSYDSTTRMPITFGTPVDLITSTNSDFVGHKFNATLYQTSSSVSGGSLDFTTTFIMEYE